MNKIAITPIDCKIGDVIAQDVYRPDDRNSLVLENTVVNEDIKNRLIASGIEKIVIYTTAVVDDAFLPNNGKRLDDFRLEYGRAMNHAKDLLNDATADRPLRREKTEVIVDTLFSHAEENYSLITCLINIKDSDNYLYTHSVNVSIYALILARWMHLSDSQVKDVVRAGLLHDFGKAKIPPAILNKPEPLTPLEYEIIRQHPTISYNIIKDLPWITTQIKEAVLAHHEREDGSGYPYNLKGKDISLYAKIIAIADVYDAMTSNMTYRHRATPFDTFREFERIGIGNFDINLMNTFLSNLAQHYLGSKVRLNTGEIGEIVFISPQSIATPIVKVGGTYIDLYMDKKHKIEEFI